MWKNAVALGFACLMGLESAVADLQFERVVLPSDRTGMDYRAQISDLASKIVGRKWASDAGIGYVFLVRENRFIHVPGVHRIYQQAYFFDIHKYIDGRLVQEIRNVMARQSERAGFVELNGEGALHLRLLDDSTLEVVPYADTRSEESRLLLTRVRHFAGRSAAGDVAGSR